MVKRGQASTAVVLTGALALIGLLAGCAPSVGKPAIRQAPNAARVFDSADPAVLVDNGAIYLFGSTNNKRLPVRRITSYTASLETSRIDWRDNAADAMTAWPAWVDPGEREIWAPSVIKIGSNYVVYFAARNGAATTDENNDQCIGRAISSSPASGYVPEAAPVYCGLPAEGAGNGLPASNRFGRGALDPEVFRAPDGRLFLLAALSRTQDNIVSLALSSDGSVAGGLNANPSILARQSLSWHDGAEFSDQPVRFLENPSMVYEPKTGTYLLFYSAGAWYNANYNTGFARCEGPTGPCNLDTRAPFLQGGNGRTGVGGLTVFRGVGGETKVAYASWQADYEGQVGSNPPGQYKRQTHWANLIVSNSSDPSQQTISLG